MPPKDFFLFSNVKNKLTTIFVAGRSVAACKSCVLKVSWAENSLTWGSKACKSVYCRISVLCEIHDLVLRFEIIFSFSEENDQINIRWKYGTDIFRCKQKKRRIIIEPPVVFYKLNHSKWFLSHQVGCWKLVWFLIIKLKIDWRCPNRYYRLNYN